VNLAKPKALLANALSEKARGRVTLIRKQIPDEIQTPWVAAVRILAEDEGMNQIYFVIIPRARLRDNLGEKMTNRLAFTHAEMFERVNEWTRDLYRLKRIDRILRSPAPATWDDGFGTTRRRYCVAHCSMCGLHFTSNAAFDEHAINERHRHPSKSKKLVAVKDVDTGCYCMGTAYDDPCCKYLPYYTQNTRCVPGVRLWEHIKAQNVREHFRGD
jgi:hypothetical protein